MAQQQICTLAQRNEVEEASDFTVDVITDVAEFQSQRDEWDRLVRSSGVRHPFMTHVWLSTWWECFGHGAELRIFIVKSGREWIGGAPMMIRRGTMCGIPVRRLETLYNPHTPRYEFPIIRRHEEVCKALWQAFHEDNSHWDVAVFQQFPSTSPTIAAFTRMAQEKRRRTGKWVGPPSPYIELDCEYDDLLNRLKTKERYNLRRRYTKLAEQGEIEMEVIKTRPEVAEAMTDGFRIEAAAWKGSAGTAMISDKRVEEFYSKLAERAADAGWLKLTFLKVGGRRIAFHLLLEHNGIVYGMKMGYDPQFHSCAPGHTLLTLILKDACDERRTEFDFLGTNDAWKLVWTKETRTHPWLFVFSNRPFGRLAHLAKFQLLPFIRSKPKLSTLADMVVEYCR